MVNPITSIIKKGEQLLKHLTGDQQKSNIISGNINEVNNQKWVAIAVEKVNKGELWKEWFK